MTRSTIEADGFTIEWDGFAFWCKHKGVPVSVGFMLSPSTIVKLAKELGFTLTPTSKALIKQSDIPQPPLPS